MMMSLIILIMVMMRLKNDSAGNDVGYFHGRDDGNNDDTDVGVNHYMEVL